eukprot:TRINITY_DN1484_c0_g1_i3.p1 TRINITY_DN1484_c0_g1~~TRINITY_DN1484_c0_g1_i3.p1  ORF type:complete len:201 (+),score=66.58 TRINITY_DN1484_c0_g1_i3:40-642(+)
MQSLEIAQRLSKTLNHQTSRVVFLTEEDDRCRLDGDRVRSGLQSTSEACSITQNHIQRVSTASEELNRELVKPGRLFLHNTFGNMSGKALLKAIDKKTILMNEDIEKAIDFGDMGKSFINRFTQESVLIASSINGQRILKKLKQHERKLIRRMKRFQAFRDDESRDPTFADSESDEEPPKKVQKIEKSGGLFGKLAKMLN